MAPYHIITKLSLSYFHLSTLLPSYTTQIAANPRYTLITQSKNRSFRERRTFLERKREIKDMGSGAGNFLKVVLRNFDVIAGYVMLYPFPSFLRKHPPFCFHQLPTLQHTSLSWNCGVAS